MRYNIPGISDLFIAATDTNHGITSFILRHITDFLKNWIPKLHQIKNCSIILWYIIFHLVFQIEEKFGILNLNKLGIRQKYESKEI